MIILYKNVWKDNIHIAVSKRGLGKGLDSMIPDKIDKTNKSESIKSNDNVSHETLL